MLVKFEEKRVLMVPHEAGAPLIRLLPGVNDVDDAAWAKARVNLKEKLAARQVIEVGATVKKEKDGEVVVGKKFSDLGAEEAEGVVADTNDVELLAKWKSTEKRDSVRLAIANRVDALNKPKKGDKPEDQE